MFVGGHGAVFEGGLLFASAFGCGAVFLGGRCGVFVGALNVVSDIDTCIDGCCSFCTTVCTVLSSGGRSPSRSAAKVSISKELVRGFSHASPPSRSCSKSPRPSEEDLSLFSSSSFAVSTRRNGSSVLPIVDAVVVLPPSPLWCRTRTVFACFETTACLLKNKREDEKVTRGRNPKYFFFSFVIDRFLCPRISLSNWSVVNGQIRCKIPPNPSNFDA